jgi:hypothetical protein
VYRVGVTKTETVLSNCVNAELMCRNQDDEVQEETLATQQLRNMVSLEGIKCH